MVITNGVKPIRSGAKKFWGKNDSFDIVQINPVTIDP